MDLDDQGLKIFREIVEIIVSINRCKRPTLFKGQAGQGWLIFPGPDPDSERWLAKFPGTNK